MLRKKAFGEAGRTLLGRCPKPCRYGLLSAHAALTASASSCSCHACKKDGLAKRGTMLPCGILPAASTANTFVIEVGRCKESKMAGEAGPPRPSRAGRCPLDASYRVSDDEADNGRVRESVIGLSNNTLEPSEAACFSGATIATLTSLSCRRGAGRVLSS